MSSFKSTLADQPNLRIRNESASFPLDRAPNRQPKKHRVQKARGHSLHLPNTRIQKHSHVSCGVRLSLLSLFFLHGFLNVGIVKEFFTMVHTLAYPHSAYFQFSQSRVSHLDWRIKHVNQNFLGNPACLRAALAVLRCKPNDTISLFPFHVPLHNHLINDQGVSLCIFLS